MDVHVRVESDADGPVVVKTAAAEAATRLRLEAELLARAVHPGVVALAGSPRPFVSPSGDLGTELRTRYAGDPATTWTGSIACVAGLGAAVATTLADLHDMGIVHGRVDATHILIGADGRPRLCGLSQPADAAAADDVAGLGTVLDQLVSRSPSDRWGALPWLRGPGGDRRALRQVIDRAVDPVASRRPTARMLADAILGAVPAAELPAALDGSAGPGSPTASRPGSTASAGSAERDRPVHSVGDSDDVGDRGDAGAEGLDPSLPGGDTLDAIWPFPDELSDDERWARALGDGPPDQPPAHGPPLPLAETVSPAWPDRADSLDTEPAGARGLDSSRVAGGSGGWLDDQLTRDHPQRAGRGGLGRRGRAHPSAQLRTRARTRLVTVAGAVGALATATVAGVTVLGSGGAADVTRPEQAGSARQCPVAAAPAADVDGDGCPEALAVDAGTVSAGAARWALGEPGDLIALGDWDCDGGASPALLRPGTGDVFVFSSWAEHGSPVTATASQRVEGGVGIRSEPGDEGCDRLFVDLASGGATTIQVPR
jgi:hypothetical protein